MTLKPVANGISNLTVSSVLGSNLSGTNTGDNPGVTVTSSGSYGGLTLTGSTGPTAATVVLGGTYWYQPIAISGNAGTVGGFGPSQTAGVLNRVVVTDGSGYIMNT
jgi:hypothetical protein